MSTHDLCVKAKIGKMYTHVNPFYNIEVGCKGVYITQAC